MNERLAGIVMAYEGKVPRIHESAYLAPGSCVVGDVEIGEESGIWFGTVVRGDVHHVRIGRRTNIQDGSLVHVTKGKWPAVIEDEVTIAHHAVVHGCIIHGCCLIGIGARVLDGAEVGPESIVAAGALVPEGFRVPPRSLVVGIPAVVKKSLADEDVARIRQFAANYVAYRLNYMK